MFNQKQLDNVIKQLMDAIPDNIRNLKIDLEKNFRSILQSAFAKFDLVTREEFDAQVSVLHRTREKLEALEEKLRKLEKQEQDKIL